MFSTHVYITIKVQLNRGISKRFTLLQDIDIKGSSIF